MLTASGPTPNSPRQTPKPANWLGVADGLAAARQAVEQGKLPYAERILREVLEFAPAEAEAWQCLAEVLQARGRPDEAMACIEKAIKLQQSGREAKTPAASARLARILWSQGEKDAARAMLAVLMMKNPDDEILQSLKHAWTEESGS